LSLLYAYHTANTNNNKQCCSSAAHKAQRQRKRYFCVRSPPYRAPTDRFQCTCSTKEGAATAPRRYFIEVRRYSTFPVRMRGTLTCAQWPIGHEPSTPRRRHVSPRSTRAPPVIMTSMMTGWVHAILETFHYSLGTCQRVHL